MHQRNMFRMFLAAAAAGLTIYCVPAFASLPDTLGKWQAGTPVKISDQQLDEAAGERAAVIREYGFLGGTRREYTRNSDKVSITEWEMKDASGSLGLFTFVNVPGMRAEKFGEGVATYGSGITFLWNGPYLLEAKGAAISKEDMETLSSQTSTFDEQRGILPSLPAFFPAENLLPMTRKYVLGPVALDRVLKRLPAAKLGLLPGIEAAVGQYQVGGNTATMVLILYPTPQLASKKFNEFLALPELTGSSDGSQTRTQRKGSLVAILLDAPSVADATRLLDRVDYETNLMWNEYVPPQGQNIGNLMMAIFGLAGAVVAFALVAGVAFGGFRIFAKKYIPFPIFDKPVDTELVKLDLDEK